MPVIPVALLSLSTEEHRRAQKEEQLKLMVANLSGLTSSPLPPRSVQRTIIRRQNNVFQGFFARKQRVVRWRVEIRLKMGWDGKAKIEIFLLTFFFFTFYPKFSFFLDEI